MRLDGSGVTPAVTPTATGAEVGYTPSVLSTGWHTVTLIFDDSAAASVTNEWQFHVANLAVRGHWAFNEQPAGNFASTNAGAILDVSGNTRHGTANSDTMEYVAGSFNYGNTPALRFTTSPDRVVVPDPAGNFNFTNSFTMEALIRSTSTAVNSAILAKNGTGDGEGEYWWRAPGNAAGAQRIGVNGAFLTGTNALNDGVWHHVALVYDHAAGELRLYADYVQEGSAVLNTERPIGRPADLQIGGFIGTTTSEFEGDIDFIRISDGALSPAQFLQTSVALQPVVKALRPADGAKNVSPTALIEAEFQNRDTSVVLSSLKLFIDGNDVTASATKTADGTTAKISFTPALPLAGGPHVATTTFSDTAVPANSWTNAWTFTNLATLPVLGFYQFNEKSPGNLADSTPDAILDSSGFDRHGTAISLTGIPYLAGSPAYGSSPALAFTVANTNHVAVPDPTGVFNWNPTQSVTLEAILRTVNIGQASVGAIMAKQSTAPEWWWRINATGFQQFNVNDGSGSRSVTGTKALNDGEWHHLAVIYDGQAKQMRAYVDYVQDGPTVTTTYTSTTSSIGSALTLYIARFQAGNRIFEGDMDAARFTAAALDPSWFIPLGGVASPVQLIQVTGSGTTFSFGFATELGRSYVVQSALTVDGIWDNEETVPGDGAVKTVSYAITGDQKLFRVRVQ
jgi:hypothetical protein